MKSRSSVRGALLALTFIGVLPLRAASAQPQVQHSAADIAEARQLFTEAMAARAAGDARSALEKFVAAHALGGTPVTGLELGRTQMTLGSLVEARESLLSVARIPVSAQETARSAAAREEAAQLAEKLRLRIPSLVVRVTGAQASSAAVSIDGVAVPNVALSAPRPVNPGKHSLRATSPAGLASAEVSLLEGETHTVDLALVADQVSVSANAAPITPAPAPVAEQASSYPLKPLLFAGIGLAGAGVIVGAVTGGLALSKASKVNDACPGLVCMSNESSNIQSGQTLGTVSTIGFVVAGAGAAAAVVALLVAHGHAAQGSSSASLQPWIGPGGAGFAGRF